MFKKIKNVIGEHIAKNRNAYIFLLMAFVFGVSAGAFTVNGLSAMQRDELTNYFQGFLQLLHNQNMDSSELFSTAFMENLKLVGLLWILGVTIIGIPFIFLIIAVRGFITGFSSGFIISVLGFKGIIFSIFTMLPKEILIVPCLIAIGVNGINFSMRLAKNKTTQNNLKDNLKGSFVSYCFVAAFFSSIILGGIILDAYITPVIVRIIAPTISI